MDERLFAVAQEEAGERPFDYGHLGRAAEFLAVALLLERGHKVALPVVDDDGVDLIVDYRTRVQVKASAGLHNGYRVFTVSNMRKRRYENVDVFLFFDRELRVFYVVPRSCVGSGYKMVISPKYEVYREAWHVFGDVALERAS